MIYSPKLTGTPYVLKNLLNVYVSVESVCMCIILIEFVLYDSKPRQLNGASGPDREGESAMGEHEKAPSHWSRTESLLDHCKIVEVTQNFILRSNFDDLIYYKARQF